MPAAAVIPAPIAYINVAAVKKLVVGTHYGVCGSLPRGLVLSGNARVARSPPPSFKSAAPVRVLLTECFRRVARSL